MTSDLMRTACYPWHVAHGGRMVDFAGWEMPVQYSSIVAEHQAVRTSAGLFDISHMGRLRFGGGDARRFLEYLLTNDVGGLAPGQVRYALVTDETGGILDDVLVYRLEENHLLVVNASNRVKILNWIEQQRGRFHVTVDDETIATCMLALQGPCAAQLLQPLVDQPLDELKYYFACAARISGDEGLVSRTGYTGEDGFELIVPAAAGMALWELLIARGEGTGLLPAGLGCRDTLRLEAAMPLYGHELDEAIDPFTAGLGFAVKLEGKDFVGREALVAAKTRTLRSRRVGLELHGKRIAREGTLVFSDDRQIGRVTSGTFSPTLQKSIALAYVPPDMATAGTPLSVEIRGQREPARVVKLPFYRRG